MPAAVIQRLVINYTRPGAITIDLTTSPLPSPDRPPAALIITPWPGSPRPGNQTGHDQPHALVAACTARLAVHGCLAVLVHDASTELGTLVAAAHDIGLTYLQHVVIAHQLPRHGPTTPVSVQHPRHPRIHSDLLLFRRPGAAHA